MSIKGFSVGSPMPDGKKITTKIDKSMVGASTPKGFSVGNSPTPSDIENANQYKEVQSQIQQVEKKIGKESIPIYGSIDILGRGIAGIFNLKRASRETEQMVERRRS